MAGVGNEENMRKIQEAMTMADQVKLGGNLKSAVAIDYTSETGNEYTGDVLFKRPTALDYIKMGAIKSEFLRTAGAVSLILVDESVKYMAQVMATLKVVVVKCPEWLLSIEKVADIDALYHVYEEYQKWDNSFRKPVQSPDSGDSKASD